MPEAQLTKARICELRKRLLAWFDASARDLPWRRTGDPYRIWVSEIMLQQTRVAAVIEHYERFLEAFPSLALLGAADETEVLALWSGLGYYRRARLLHRAARFLAREHGGRLPRTAEALRKLPGIGEYTAAAVASIAFGEPVAVVDGNVARVLERIFGGENGAAGGGRSAAWLRERAARLLETARPGDWNQATMELGAMVCLPREPKCGACPVEKFCATRGEHAAPAAKKMRSRQVTYGLALRERAGGRQVLLERRPDSAPVMAGMWELPEMRTPEPEHAEQPLLALRHSITVTSYYVRIFGLEEKGWKARLPKTENERRWVRTDELGKLPLTGLARKALRRQRVMRVDAPPLGRV